MFHILEEKWVFSKLYIINYKSFGITMEKVLIGILEWNN